MPRPITHVAVRPFQITRSAIEAHQSHAPTPFMGCPLCLTRGLAQGRMQELELRWTGRRAA